MNASRNPYLIAFIRVILAVATIATAGCSSVGRYSKVFDGRHIPSETVYVRGSMSFWDAAPEYRFTRAQGNALTVGVNLFADGDAYEFKIADNEWSSKLNCGGKNTPLTLQPNTKVALYCDNNSHNISFKPSVSGTYLLTLSFIGKDDVQLTIEAVSP